VKANLFFTHQKALGTNPMSFGAPASDGDAFVLDMATTAVAVGKVKFKGFLPTVQGRETQSNLIYIYIYVYVYTYRVIQNDCLGFNNLSYTIHLR
jgi:hypothetical protein